MAEMNGNSASQGNKSTASSREPVRGDGDETPGEISTRSSKQSGSGGKQNEGSCKSNLSSALLMKKQPTLRRPLYYCTQVRLAGCVAPPAHAVSRALVPPPMTAVAGRFLSNSAVGWGFGRAGAVVLDSDLGQSAGCFSFPTGRSDRDKFQPGLECS